MRKRLLIGLLTTAMITQSLSMPVMAAPAEIFSDVSEAQADESSDNQLGVLAEEQPGDETSGQTDKPGDGQSDVIPQEDPAGEQQEEENPNEPTKEEPDEEQPGETPEEQPSDETGEQTGEPEADRSDDMLEDQLENTSGEESEELTEEMSDEETDSQQPAETESGYVDVSDGVYQEGSFTVLDEDADSDWPSNSIMSETFASAKAEAEEYIYQQLLAKKSSIDISKYSISTSVIGALYSGVLNEHPDLYYVTSGIRYSYNPSTGTVAGITPTYISGLNDIAFRSGLNRALAVVRSDMSDLEKAIALHDYLVINCEYDYDNYLAGSIPQTSYSAYGVFVNGAAVCQGYALAYKLLLNKVGIDCYMVSSKSMSHAWNLIVLDGKYYQVDTTWDDPVWDLTGRVVHTYMFRSDDAFNNHYGWEITSGSEVVNYTATDTRYDSAFWVNCKSPLVLAEDGCYYIAFEGSAAGIKKKESLEDITNTGTTIQSIGRWPVWGGGGSWSGSYSGLFLMDGRLYYNDTTYIYSIAPDGTDQRIEFKADTTNGYIYGSALSRGKVLYCLHQTPNLSEKETVLVADIAVSGEDDWNQNIMIQPPTLTTYKVGQSINLKGGKVTYLSGNETKTVDISTGMISGFDSTKPGICTVNVTCGDYMASFDTLIVEEPKLTAMLGQKLGDVAFPENGYGTYFWQDGTRTLDTVSVQTFNATFTPNDKNAFQELTDLKIQVTVQAVLGDSTDVTFKSSAFTYNGTEQEPKVIVSVANNVLIEGQDYTLSYRNNINAGDATVIVEGTNGYLGSVSRTFKINPAPLTVMAKDLTLLIGATIPETYEYEVKGLVEGDELLTKPSFSCDVVYEQSAGNKKAAKVGRYEIIPHSADAGDNYKITYEPGKLTVAEEYVSYAVNFNMQGHGTAPDDYVGIKGGSTIAKPDIDPTAAGYRFDGWYQDAACTKAWNFDTDTVQTDITLYAKWLKVSEEGGFAIQEISDVYYTGKACKPAVSVYDGETLLKAGRDYQIKYYNNTNANKGNMLKEGNGEGKNFKAELPYVEITGRGNYTDVVKVNFNILKASIGDGSEDPAAGITLKVSDQLVTAKKALKPFSSIKYVTGMKQGTDYTLALTVVNARDQAGRSLAEGSALENAAIPAGYEGEFRLSVQGIGNYEGTILKTIYVTDKSHLIKNANITLGKNLKNVEYTAPAVILTPSEENSADTFTVKCGNAFLRYNKDYTVSYRNNDRVGKAELIITGMGEYAGSKAVIFNIKGKTFTAKNVKVSGIADKVYTGRAWTQNGAVLTYGEGTGEQRTLNYGTDYTISYSKNVNKGTATMTIKGVDKAGFSGSFKKTFKITAQDISKVKQAEGMQNITVGYTKAGANPEEKIVLTNSEGITLSNGKDYTLKYANNKAVANAGDEKPPTIIIKGKGNYTGELKVYYNINKGDLAGDNITIKASSVGYQANKAVDYVYKPSVKLMDGKTALRAGTDYELEYVKNTQGDYVNYMQKLGDRDAADNDMPRAVITEKAGSNYKLSGSITVPLPIYQTKLTTSNLTVEIGKAVYTGDQVKPEVKVRYRDASGDKVLIADKDYTISYGANNQSGKNKGSVTISGIAPYYGGDVTVKFEIIRKPILY